MIAKNNYFSDGPPGQGFSQPGNTCEPLELSRMAGRTLGLIGLGRIGKAVVPRAIGLGMKVIATDPLADAEFAKQHNVRLVSLDELLAEADVVSLHAPATEATLATISNQHNICHLGTLI